MSTDHYAKLTRGAKATDALFARIRELRANKDYIEPESVSVLIAALLALEPESKRFSKALRKLGAKEDAGVPRNKKDEEQARAVSRFFDRAIELEEAIVREQAFHRAKGKKR